MNNVKSYVQVKEYGLLVETGDDTNPNHAEVSTSAFNWLMSNGLSIAGRELVRVKRMGKKLALQVVNFVGKGAVDREENDSYLTLTQEKIMAAIE